MAPPPYRFTIFALDSCIEMARAVYNSGGLLSSTELAKKLGYKSENNGSFNTRLANARLFGLLTGPSSAIRPSDRAIAILSPDSATADRARLEAFEGVPLFKAVLDEYHGKPLPDESGLRNALTTRWGITEDKAPMVYARLMDCADQAGLFRVAGDRTMMIRPTLSAGVGASAAHEKPLDPNIGSHGDPFRRDQDGGVRANKVIDGVLDMLPDGTWDESGLRQWLTFFEDALRLYYKLPRAAQAGSPNGAVVPRHQEVADVMTTG